MVDITKTSSLPYLATGSTGTKVVSGSGATSTSATDKATDNAEQLRTQFLNILLTQMQNQNPLDPMDTKEFTGQLAQFSSLEQQINTNSKLDSLLTSMQSNAATSAFGYIGQTAELNSKLSVVEDGGVNWNYAINSAASKVNIKITDSTGKVLYSKDDTNIPSGTYSLKALVADLSDKVPDGTVLGLTVTASDETGAAVRTDISTVVKVDGVESSANGIDLRSGGLLFSLDDVLRFKSIPKTTTTTSTTTSTSTAA